MFLQDNETDTNQREDEGKIDLRKVQSLIQKFDNRENENLARKGRAKKPGLFSSK